MNDKYVIISHSGIIMIDETEILYFLAKGSYTIIKFRNGKIFKVSKNLKNCIKLLQNKELFKRTHRSCFINLTCDVSIAKSGSTKYNLMLGEDILPVCVDFVKKLKLSSRQL